MGTHRSISQLRKLNLREVQLLAQGHTVGSSAAIVVKPRPCGYRAQSGHITSMCMFTSCLSPKWLNGKKIHLQCRRHKRCRFGPRVRKIPWRRKWQHIPVFLAEKSHGQRSLVGHGPWGHKELDTAEWLSTHYSLILAGHWCRRADYLVRDIGVHFLCHQFAM